ncbi:recombinase family protein [Pseudomonas parafulva]|uniref:recombinase family protein n=1 Tax=Pseudomonas parafulva TaxID=157782 RepID=UPI0035656925
MASTPNLPAVDVQADQPVPADAPKRLAYSYVRYSSEQQMTKKNGEVGDSIRRQMENQRKAVETYNLHVVDVFEDLGKSAFRGKHRLKGALSLFLASLDEGKIPSGAYLLIESFDRLSRERMTDGLTVVLTILRKGIKIITTDDLKLYDLSIKGKDLEQTIMITVLLERANNESTTKSDRQKAKWEGRRDRIIKGEKKFLNKNVPWWISLDEASGKYALIPERVAELKKIYELLMVKNLGLRAAAAHINENNPLKVAFGKNPDKSGWTARGIKRMIDTPSLYGSLELCEYIYDNGKSVPDRKTIQVMENFYPAAFTKHEVELLKAKIASRMTSKEKPTRRDLQYYNIYHGLIKCEFCGGNVRFSQKQKYSYLVCRNSEIKLCKYPKTLSMQYERFHEVFFKYAEHYNFDLLIQSGGNDNADLVKEITELEETIVTEKHKAQKFTEKLLDMFDGEIPDEQEAAMITRNKKIKSLESKVKALRAKIVYVDTDAETLSDAIQYASKLVESKDGRLELSNHLTKLIDKMVVDFGKAHGRDSDYVKVLFKNKDYSHHFLFSKDDSYSYDSDGELFLDTLDGITREGGYYLESRKVPDWEGVEIPEFTDEEIAAAEIQNSLNPPMVQEG